MSREKAFQAVQGRLAASRHTLQNVEQALKALQVASTPACGPAVNAKMCKGSRVNAEPNMTSAVLMQWKAHIADESCDFCSICAGAGRGQGHSDGRLRCAGALISASQIAEAAHASGLLRVR